METLNPIQMLTISKLLGLVLFIMLSLITITLTRMSVLHIFQKEFKIIHKKVFEEGNVAVAIYSGLIIGLIALGLIYAFTNFML